MKTYRGYRHYLTNPAGEALTLKTEVTVEEHTFRRDLDPRRDLRDHMPFQRPFDWGHGCNGSLQLALALLADSCGDALAGIYYVAFHDRVVSRLSRDGWALTSAQVTDEVLMLVEAAGRKQP